MVKIIMYQSWVNIKRNVTQQLSDLLEAIFYLCIRAFQHKIKGKELKHGGVKGVELMCGKIHELYN